MTAVSLLGDRYVTMRLLSDHYVAMRLLGDPMSL